MLPSKSLLVTACVSVLCVHPAKAGTLIEDASTAEPPSGMELVGFDGVYDDDLNEAGGKWLLQPDTGLSYWGGRSDWLGSSTASLLRRGGDEFNPGSLTVTARLSRYVQGSPRMHGGWIRLASGIEGDGVLVSEHIDAFAFKAGAASLPASVEGLRFSVRQGSVPDSALHGVLLPRAMLLNPGLTEFTVPATHLVQDDGVLGSDRREFSAVKGISELLWSVQLAPGVDSMASGDTVRFTIGLVRIHGITSFDGLVLGCCGPSSVRSESARAAAVSARYASGILSLRGIGDVVSISVMGLDGRIVSEFAPAARIPLHLARGTWILAARKSDGAVVRSSFVALGR